jgi:formylglycine-generating enzyme required for sulfatase activity
MRSFQRRSFLTALFTVVFLVLTKATAQPPPPVPDTPRPVPLSSLPDFGEITLDGIVFIKIPAGKYRRGTSEEVVTELTKRGWWRPQNRVEQPVQEVTLTRPFLLGKFEVTQDQWMAVMGEKKNPSAFKGGTLPVETVSYNDVQGFCKTLSEKTKAVYRLPTEAEWEYAARAGGAGAFGMGADKQEITADSLGDYAWMNNNAGYKTHPVGQKKPNAWGLYDMLGNVWGWCEDGFSPTVYTAAPVTDPLFPPSQSTERVFRGGCYFLDGRAQRVAIRGGNLPAFKSPYVGFRLVREL